MKLVHTPGGSTIELTAKRRKGYPGGWLWFASWTAPDGIHIGLNLSSLVADFHGGTSMRECAAARGITKRQVKDLIRAWGMRHG